MSRTSDADTHPMFASLGNDSNWVSVLGDGDAAKGLAAMLNLNLCSTLWLFVYSTGAGGRSVLLSPSRYSAES